ncbi:Cloroperoxidase [Mycena indigotica]|uniref:Cloroperoxidase n=1 Tax=Mycena indigotica TaxID=2126181 RepID=A0A8H6T100_9AGAR|nr:Cloroperoxidase [Mycena indigotica]KAF7309995.1 Cloroperoxidase [Mycena indigotica]
MTPLLTFLSFSALVFASTTNVQDGQTGTLIVLPPQATDTGTKQIPDADHPFIAPGAEDQRGPCPAMNTLANHGYIPRNGIATFEEITLGMMEAFNIELLLGASMISNNMLTRGNAFVNKISIGGVSPDVPALPYNIDGPVTGGIAKHGRFEGDASMTRADAFIGDNRNFQNRLYDLDLLELGKFGSPGIEGNNTVWNIDALIAMKKQNIAMDQAENHGFEFAAHRMNAAYMESAFILTVFANGTTKEASLSTIGSFFRNQTFPSNWHRAASPVSGSVVAPIIKDIFTGVGLAPGRNDANGVYGADPTPSFPFNTSLACEAYFDQAANIPSVLVNTTGILKSNVDLMTDILFQVAAANPECTQKVLPFGPADV